MLLNHQQQEHPIAQLDAAKERDQTPLPCRLLKEMANTKHPYLCMRNAMLLINTVQLIHIIMVQIKRVLAYYFIIIINNEIT